MTECRVQFAGVKEASERAILTLRSLQSQYVSAVRASTSSKSGSNAVPHPTTALFRSQDVLRPFLLACNYPDASSSLLLIGLNAIQLLISGDAVCPEDSVHIARVLGIQAACCCRYSQNDNGPSNQSRGGAGGVVASLFGAASSIPGGGYYSSSGFSGSGHRSIKDDEAISLKVLQTLTIMIASKELELSDEVLGQAVSVCLTLISGNESSKEDRNKKKYHRNNAANVDRDGNGNHLASLGGNDNMRRAAAATLKQILIFTFDRAESNDTVEGQDSKHLKMTRHAAASAFADLCSLSESRLEGEDRVNKGLPPRSEVKGPFSTHGSSQNKRKSIQPPPRSACFEMLNMILNHKPELFTGEVTDAQKVMVLTRSDDDMSDSFAALLRYKVCPLVSSFLLSEFNVSELSKAGGDEKNGSGKEDFSLLMRSTRLACTIIENFGKSKDLISECHILLTALVRFISSFSEAFRDTHEFEDGFIYSMPSQVLAMNEVNNSNTWRNNSSLQTGLNSSLVSNILLWRCALALESLYSIVKNPEMLKFLHLSYDHICDKTKLVSLIAECLSDFATTAASNKSSILSVARVVSFRQENGWDESGEGQDILHPQIFARARNITNLYDDWESSLNEQNANFSNQISMDMASFDECQIPFCDIGEAIWVAFNCTLSLSSSLHQISLDKSPEMKSLIGNSFPPTLTALHHFLKRFPSETYIRNTVLMGFENLAGTCIPFASEDALQSEALVKSLCVLSLPTWGNMESNW